ncbi:caspase domain-containing protein, partial [Streptomyces sp. NPDC056333]|uniref:caspase family protein n=1 Tax=Streptomyces sp. NPDC056333 TaxID=3345786 RepID=UPI0035E12F65
MSERAIDPARSRIVLVGPAYYDDPQLENVPVIANNISDLAQVLTNEKLGGFNPFHCIAVPSAAGVAQVGDALVRAAEEAEDLLLFYYAGHGLLGPRRRDLYLSLAATRPDQLAFTAVPFEAVRDACLQSRATSRVVILDSCYSGRAIGDTLAGDDEVGEAVLGEIEVSGAYTLTSSPANRAALVLPGERHTAFTERLLAMLSAGSPAAGTMISLGDIYRHLHTRLRAEGLPLPQRCGVNNADLLGLVRNIQSGHAPGDAPAAADTAESESVAGTDMTQRLTHAERIANTIGDGLWRTRALARVALAADACDPDRVGRLIDQVEQAASTIANEDYRWQALSAVATSVAAVDPDRAEHLANTITNQYTRWQALGAVAAAVAAADPDRAERMANTITNKDYRWQAFSAVAAAVAAANPDWAEHMANTIINKDYRWQAFSAVAAAVAAANPDRAEHIANSITDKYTSDSALAAVAKAVAASHPDRAEHIANTITNKSLKLNALSAVAQAVAVGDPERAEHLANEMTRTHNRWRAFLSVDTTRATALSAVASTVAADDPDRAERIARAISDRSTSEGVLAAVAKAVAADDPDRAERIARAISDRSTSEGVLAAVAKA